MISDSKDTILLFGAGTGQLPYLRHFRQRGYRVAAIDRDPGAPGATEADLFLAFSTHDDRAIRDGICAEKLQKRIAAVICPTTGWAYVSAARIAAWLGVFFSSEAAALNILDKFRLWQALNNAGLTRRKAWQYSHSADQNPDPDFPLVVKPQLAGGGHRGVNVAHGPNELPGLFQKAADVSLNGSVLLEEQCLGHEIKLTGFIEQGRVVLMRVAQRTFGPGHPGVPVGLAFGGKENSDADMRTFIEQACAALDLTTTSFNVDVIITATGPELIDFDLALGNFQLLWQEAEGFSVPSAVADLALGHRLKPPRNTGESVALTNLWLHLPQAVPAQRISTLYEQQIKRGQSFIPAPNWDPGSILPAGLCRLGALLSRAKRQQEALIEGDRWLESIQKSGALEAGLEFQVLRPTRPFEFTIHS